MSKHKLVERFARLRTRYRVIGGAAGFGWAFSIAVSVMLAAMWLDLIWDLSGRARMAAWIAAGLAATATIVVWLVRTARHTRTTALADEMDRTGTTAGSVRTAWDLAETKQFDSLLQHGLAQLAVRRGTTDAYRVDDAAVAPWSIAAWALAGVPLMIFVVLGLAFVAPHAASVQWRRFASPFADVPPYSPISLRVAPGDVRVPYGSGFDIHVETAGPPVEQVTLVIESGDGATETLPMFVHADGGRRAMLTSVVAPAVYYVRADGARSERYKIDVITVPRLEDLRVRISPPGYTQTAAYEGPLPARGIVGLKGTVVTFWAKSNRPLSGGTLTVDCGGAPETVPLLPQPADANTVVGTYELHAPGKFELRVVDTAGQESQDTFAGAIELSEDQRPFIRLLKPRETSLAVPDATVPVEWAAVDDYGVAKVEVYRSLNDSLWLPLDQPQSSPPAKRSQGSFVLALSTYGLAPGDEIKLFPRVEDNDPDGTKGFDGGTAVIRIISQEEFQRMVRLRHTLEMLSSKYRQAQRRLDSALSKKDGLQKKLKDKKSDEAASDEDRKALAALSEQLQKDVAELRAAAGRKLPYDLDEAMAKHLEKHIDRLQKAADGLQRLTLDEAGKPMTNAELQAALESLGKELAEADLDFEQKAMEPIEHLERVFPLMADEAKFVELVRRQRELADRIAAQKQNDGADDPAAKARLRDLEAEQGRLRDDLAELLADVEKHTAELPEDEQFDDLRESAAKFAEAVRKSGAPADMESAEDALAGLAAKTAATKADDAADKLEQLLGQCKGMGGQAGACLRFSPGLSAGLGDTIGQLLADLGLSPGQGGGSGGGGGFSSTRNGSRNMGLYGNLPALGGNDAGGLNDDGGGTGDRGRGSEQDEGAPTNDVRSVGDGPVDEGSRLDAPLPYRRRVADYFRRLAEDADD